MKVPFNTLLNQHDHIRSELLSVMESMVVSPSLILGDNVRHFEFNLASYIQTSYSAGVGSGLDALILSLKSLDIGPGDEVIVPSNSYIATVIAVSHVGATPVFAEPELASFNIDPVEVKRVLTHKTKAIIPVHLYGYPCAMEPIMNIADENGIYVIEDNAQALGAIYGDKKTGSFGTINATSFYPTKNLGAFGDAGAISTNDKDLLQKVHILRNYGSDKKYQNSHLGYNSRLDELQAAILNLKLSHLDKWNKERCAIHSMYRSLLLPEVSATMQPIVPEIKPAYHLVVIRHPKRDELKQYLATQGIDTVIHYPVPPHLQEVYKSREFKKGDFPIAEAIASTILSLPCFIGMTNEQIEYVCTKINEFEM